MSIITYDLISTCTSLLATYFFIKISNKAWIIGILATCLNGYLYWQKGIYADMVLEELYFVSCCYGWYMWTNNHHHNSKHVLRKLSLNQWVSLLTSTIICYVIVLSLLQTYTDSTIAKMDALTTALSLSAQWLMCYKVITTWFFWFIVDALYAYIYLQKDLPYHCTLMFIYLAMAVTGFISWSKIKRQPDACPPVAS